MSHFTEVKTKLKNKDRIKHVLESMGYTVEENPSGVEVRGFFGEITKADFKIHAGNNYDIGFICKDESYEIIGDWELLPKVAQLSQVDFTNKVSRQYAVQTVREIAEQQNLSLDMSESEDGQIEMVVTQW